MRGTHYYVKVTNDGRVAMGSLIQRKKAPRMDTTGRWMQLDSALGLCCDNIPNAIPAPRNFVASDGGTGVINLNWTGSTGATNYRLERATNAGFTAGYAALYYGPNLTFSDTGRTSGVQYFYRVSAIGTTTSQFAYTNRVAS